MTAALGMEIEIIYMQSDMVVTAINGFLVNLAEAVAIVIVVLNFRSEFWCARWLRARPVVFVGTISFSLYLRQQPFANPDLVVPHAFPLGIVWALLAATASYFLVEKPFLRLKDRYSAREARRVRDDALRMPASGEAIGAKVAE